MGPAGHLYRTQQLRISLDLFENLLFQHPLFFSDSDANNIFLSLFNLQEAVIFIYFFKRTPFKCCEVFWYPMFGVEHSHHSRELLSGLKP